MRLGIDLTGLDNNYVGGLTTFALGLLSGLTLSVHKDYEIIIFCKEVNAYHFEKWRGVNGVRIVNIKFNKIARYIKYIFRIYCYFMRNFELLIGLDRLLQMGAVKKIEANADALIAPLTLMPVYGLSIPTILCIHDIQQEYFPENFSFINKVSRWAEYRASCFVASKIQVSSSFIKECILEKFVFLNENKIFTSPEGVDFARFNLYANAAKPQNIKNPNCKDYIFYPAQLWRHKNHILLIKSLIEFKKKMGYELKCILCGVDYGEYVHMKKEIDKYGLREIEYLGRVANDELIWLYKNASVVLAIGSHESSSLPVREAAVFGKKIICSNIPPNQEVSHVLDLTLVNIENENQLLQSFFDLFCSEEKFNSKTQLNKNNMEAVKCFDWRLLSTDYITELKSLNKLQQIT